MTQAGRVGVYCLKKVPITALVQHLHEVGSQLGRPAYSSCSDHCFVLHCNKCRVTNHSSGL